MAVGFVPIYLATSAGPRNKIIIKMQVDLDITQEKEINIPIIFVMD
jgi:hypothetical protein